MWHRVCPLSELPDGGSIRCDLGEGVAIFRVDGELFAIDDTCTHGKSSLAQGWVENCEVECNFHFGRFDLRTGKAVAFPAAVDVRTHPVDEIDGYVALWFDEGVPASGEDPVENQSAGTKRQPDSEAR